MFCLLINDIFGVVVQVLNLIAKASNASVKVDIIKQALMCSEEEFVHPDNNQLEDALIIFKNS
jgi:hypothetical protein